MIGEYTADQWGMITTAQATAAGIDSVTLYRLADAGHLEPLRRGVYAAAAAPASPHRDIQAAWLSLNPKVPAWQRPKLDPDGAVVSHRTAALIHDIGDMVVDTIELTVPRRRVTRDPLVATRLGNLADHDVTLVDGLPITTVMRTIEDLLADHLDASHVASVIKDAVDTRRLDLEELAARVGRYCRRYGVKSQDGNKLIDHLLEQIGTTRPALARAATTTSLAASSRQLRNTLTHAFPSTSPAAIAQLQRIAQLERVQAQQPGLEQLRRHNAEAIASAEPLRRQLEALDPITAAAHSDDEER